MRAWKGMKATCHQGSVEIEDATNWGNKKISMGRGVFEGGLKKGKLSKEFVQHLPSIATFQLVCLCLVSHDATWKPCLHIFLFSFQGLDDVLPIPENFSLLLQGPPDLHDL